MMNDPLYNRLCEASWRRPLTEAEQAELRAWLAAHPEAQAEWAAEAGLNDALARLPDVPLASNFTARVLQAAQRESAREARAPAWGWRFWQARFRWLPRVAFAAMVLSAGLISYHHVQVTRRVDLVQGVAAVAEVASLPSPEILKDFDAIRALDQTPPADEELLTLMQ
ncbi:MAG TPA: hypothetical protein VNZ22_22245 [Bacillota bacterium]|nr:hypothetical protein [Bacillota bacterium]